MDQRYDVANIIIENSPTVLFIWKAEENWPVEYVSENIKQFGYTSEEFYSGKIAYSDIMHPDDLARIAKEVETHSRNHDEKFTQEYRILSKKGRVHWVDDRTVILRDKDGKITHYQGIIIDITDKKKSQLEIERLSETLKKAQGIAHIGHWELDTQTNNMSWSDEVYNIFGMKPHAFKVTYKAFLDLVHPEDRKKVADAYDVSVKTGEPYQIVHRVLRGDNEIRVVEERCTHYKDSGGKVIRSVGTVHDITEFKKIEEELIRLNHTLERKVEDEMAKRRDQELQLIQQSKLASMGEMISAIAHQWRQPINGLNLMVADIKEAFTYGDLNSEYIRRFEKNARKQINFMAQTIEDFKGFVKPEAEKGRFKPYEAIDELITLFGTYFSKKNIEVKLQKDSHCNDEVFGCENYFKQVMLNLINNAYDAYNECKKCIDKDIEIILYEEDGCIAVSLRDYAGGIREEIIDKIFDPYVTTKGDKGTGIGLSISRTILERMGATISVKNREDDITKKRGAEFTIKFERGHI